MRLFLAVPVPPSEAYAEVTRQLADAAPRARPVPAGSWHATLRFLGEVVDPAPVVAAVAPAAASHPAGSLAVRGVGAFPSPRKARVAWAGVEASGIDRLAAALAQATAAWGGPETRPFHAHVTLARLDAPTDLAAFVAEHEATPFGAGALADVELLRSDLGPGGPRYTRVARFPLAQPGAF